MPTAISTGFRHPLGDGTLTEAWDGDGFYVPQGNPALPGYIAGGANFGDPYDPNDLSRGYHVGEDWNFEVGDDLNAPVYAASNGQIVYANAYGHGMGNVIVIRHDLPGGGAVYSLYAHLDARYISLIGTVGTAGTAILGSGKLVTIGDRICGVGNTGPTSPHLHFEIYQGRWDLGLLEFGYSTTPRPSGWIDPTDFIEANRTLGVTATRVN